VLVTYELSTGELGGYVGGGRGGAATGTGVSAAADIFARGDDQYKPLPKLFAFRLRIYQMFKLFFLGGV
jgi:hypothetical protein